MNLVNKRITRALGLIDRFSRVTLPRNQRFRTY